MQLRHATRQLCIVVSRRTLRTRRQQDQQEKNAAVQTQENGQQ